MEVTERQLKEAKTVIDQVKSEVEKIPDPGPLKAVLDGLVKWMALTTSIQENSASVMLDEFAKASKKVSPPPGLGRWRSGQRRLAAGKEQAR
jgi:hypothetical protein